MNKAEIRLECLKLVYSQNLKGTSHLETAEMLFEWIHKDSPESKPTEEPAKVVKPQKGRKKKAEQGPKKAPVDSPKADELFD